MIKITSAEVIHKDRPDGEIIYQDYVKSVYIFGIVVHRRIIKYEGMFENQNKKGYK
jgi:hypothetical protein